MKPRPVVLVLLCLAGLAAGQDLPRYKKLSYMIPMRDGVKLYTSVYVPVGVAGKHPILLERTPYSAGPYGEDTRDTFDGSVQFRKLGYIFAFQDVRGKFMSEGQYVNIRPELAPGQKGTDESTDAYDTIDYLVKNVPDNNDRVGLWGISYPGFYAAAGAIHTHPALKAVSPQAPVSDWFVGDDFHHNGALFLQDAFSFLSGFGQVRPEPSVHEPAAPPIDWGDHGAYDFYLKLGALPNANARYLHGSVPFWDDIMRHGTYDAWWRARNLPSKLVGVKCAVLTVGGFFDAEDMWGALYTYARVERQNPGIYNALVMGPWYHGMWAGDGGDRFGDLEFGQPTSAWFKENVEFPFFDHYLRDGGEPLPAEATMFETGSNRWRKFAQWPPSGLKPLSVFLESGRALAWTKPTRSGAERYVNDPANPTPYIADRAEQSRTAEYMVDDQRFASARPDVLTYSSPALTKAVTVAGPISVDLVVSTSGTDSDFVVKVIDQYPPDLPTTALHVKMGGYQQLLRADVMRGKFRESLSHPKPFVPGAPTPLRFRLNDVLHTFRPGHRIVVQVQSAWFPLVDRNPNRFEDIYRAKDSDFQKATIRVYHGPRTPSRLVFGTLPE